MNSNEKNQNSFLEEYQKLFDDPSPAQKIKEDSDYYQNLFQDKKFLELLQQKIYETSLKNLQQVCTLQALEQIPQNLVPQTFKAGVKINFVGPFIGTMCLLFYRNIGQTILHNMLGPEEDSSLELDALGELANIICGNILPFLSQDKDILKMTPPGSLSTNDFTSIQRRFCPTHLQFAFETGEIEIYLFIKNVLVA